MPWVRCNVVKKSTQCALCTVKSNTASVLIQELEEKDVSHGSGWMSEMAIYIFIILNLRCWVFHAVMGRSLLTDTAEPLLWRPDRKTSSDIFLNFCHVQSLCWKSKSGWAGGRGQSDNNGGSLWRKVDVQTFKATQFSTETSTDIYSNVFDMRRMLEKKQQGGNFLKTAESRAELRLWSDWKHNLHLKPKIYIHLTTVHTGNVPTFTCCFKNTI